MNYSDYRRELMEDPEFLEEWKNLQVKSELGKALVRGRIKFGWSQSELARQVGTKQANISRIESALANPTIELVQRILRVLELEAHFLPTANTTTPDRAIQEIPPIEAVDWPLQKSAAHQIGEPRKKKK